jgi:hypothetical protein
MTQINDYIAKNPGDKEKYTKAVDQAFATLAGKITHTNFKTIFGDDYKNLNLITPYLNENTLRNLYETERFTASRYTDKTNLAKIINEALLTPAINQIITNLKKVNIMQSDISTIYNNNKTLFAYAKKVENLATSIKNALNNWPKTLANFNELRSKDTPSNKLLTPNELAVK